VAKTVNIVKEKWGKVMRELEPVKDGSTVTAFIEDPSGDRFELLGRRLTREPLCKVMLQADNLDCVIAFYEKAVGMKLLHKIVNPK
ncbi:lactoylglutathione lyase, putative, partial [Medicago truncatula]